MSKWKVTWLTNDGPFISVIQADEMTFTPAGGAVLGNVNKVVDIKQPQTGTELQVVSHVQGYTSLVKVDSLVEDGKAGFEVSNSAKETK